ncbi:MAG: asparagine synthase (glutamine-hydrolyzing) [Ignavibacteriales bacterium]|nr:asparagine synthase (glutamine-hydrolyzing) [Ignavibacteriales bacterium]
MCGISGILNLKNPASINTDHLRRMTFALRHRGPDETGAYIDDWVGLAQSRLSIIDLSGGSQPIHNEDKTFWIVFNGEIFNYPEIRESLIKLGHKFYTTSDTEVILHLYEEKKERCLDDLNGQFAFVIWDSVKKEFFAARDRVGILPFFYKTENEKLLFASEAKAIIEISDSSTSFDPIGLDQIFTFWTNLPGRTAFKNINELAPGHYLKFSPGKDISVSRYWSLPYNKNLLSEEKSIPEFTSEISDLMKDSIRIRLRADVPVGSYLSGGLDSSGITAFVKNYFNNELRTFGITFQEESFDESEFQHLMIKHLNTNHSEVHATNEDIGKYFSDIVYYGEKPIIRAAPVPLYLLSKKVREEGYKVVLTGEGADEIFGGYNIFKETKVRKFWSVDPTSQLRPKLLQKLYPYIFKDKRLVQTLQAFFKLGIEDSNNSFFSHIVRWNNNTRLKNFFSNDFKEQIGDYNAYDDLKSILPKDFDSWDYVYKAQYLEIITFMSGYLLSSQGDRMAMANSVELRVPYLDHRIIEYMATVPSRFKIRGLNEKYLLKKVFNNLLPQRIVNRAKNPYRAPIRNSFLNNKSLDLKTVLSEKEISYAGVFNPDKVNLLMKKAERTEALSELDNMALAGIISTQFLHNDFINHKKLNVPDNYRFNTFIDKRNQIN